MAGDFMTLPFEPSSFDVLINLELLSHVADQPGLVSRFASLIKPGGHVMMATQNEPVLRRWAYVSERQPGQLRRWVDKRELRGLLTPYFDVVELFSITPVANKGAMRYVNSKKLNAPVRLLVGDRLERLTERLWLGWTLMALGRKRLDADVSLAHCTREEVGSSMAGLGSFDHQCVENQALSARRGRAS